MGYVSKGEAGEVDYGMALFDSQIKRWKSVLLLKTLLMQCWNAARIRGILDAKMLDDQLRPCVCVCEVQKTIE